MDSKMVLGSTVKFKALIYTGCILGLNTIWLCTSLVAGPWNNNTTTRMRVDYLEDSKLIEGKKPDVILQVLGVKEGDSVADVGAGTGFFTFLLSSKVGKKGKVYAVDILDDMLSYINTKAQINGIKNIATVKATPASPNLPPASCDKIVLIDTYVFLKEKMAYLAELHKALRPGGTIALISGRHLNKNQTDIDFENKIVVEMEKAGFRLTGRNNSLGKRYFLLFTPAS